MPKTAQVGDGEAMSEVVINFDDIFDAFVATLTKTWSHDRSSTLGGSEVYGCLRQGFFEKRHAELGFEPDEDFEQDWGAMERGNLYEKHYIAPAISRFLPQCINAEDVKVLYTDVDGQETLVSGRNSATPDGLITGLPKGCRVRVLAPKHDIDIVIEDIVSDCICLEFKTIDPRATLMEERQKHHNQTQVQIGLFHETTEHKPYYSIVLYVDASFISKVIPFVVEYDPTVYAQAKVRADAIWQTDDPAMIVPEGRFSDACKHCRWRHACGTATKSAIPSYDVDPQATPETIAAMDVLARDVLAKRAAADAAELEWKLAQEAVKEMLMGRNTKKMQGPGWSVTWYAQDGKTTVDLKALRASGIDLEPFEKVGAGFDVLRVTPKLEKAEKAQKAEGATKKPRKKKE